MILPIPNFPSSLLKVLISTLLFVNFTLTAAVHADNDNYDYLLKGYPEAQKNQMKRAITFTTQKYPGKVVGINRQTDNEETFFRVKLLNSKGQLKTYYLDKSINKISP